MSPTVICRALFSLPTHGNQKKTTGIVCILQKDYVAL